MIIYNVQKRLLFVLIVVAWLIPGSTAGADDCGEATKWYYEGLSLSDHSEREASYYRKAIELCPEYFEVHNKLGEGYKSRGEYELAIKAFEQASRSPSFARPHYNLGEIYRIQGRYDLAAEEFSKAIRMKPDLREAQNQLQYVQKRLGRYDSAIEAPPGPIPTSVFGRIPGMTLPKGSFLVDFQYKYWNQEAGLKGFFLEGEAPPLWGPPSRDVDVHVWIFGIRYGLTNDLTIGLIPKFFSRTANVNIPSVVDAEPHVTGFGDTIFLTKYRLWSRRMNHLSAFGLLSIPTGDEDAVDEDKGILRSNPLGAGDFSFAPGLAWTAVIEPFTIHTNIWGIISSGEIARQAGDEFRCDLALVFPRFHNFISMVELNYRWQDSARRSVLWQMQLLQPPRIGPSFAPFSGGPVTEEAVLIEPGGQTLFLSPGVQVFFTKNLKGELGIQFPIIRPEDDGWVEQVLFHAGLVKYFF